jgi:hypothetical protein
VYSLIRALLILLIPTLLFAGTLQEEAYKVAARDAALPVIERTNSNDHPRIDEYCKNVGIPRYSPYCAASVYTWYKEASETLHIKNPAYKSGATAEVYRAALANPMRYKFIKPRLVKLGSEKLKLGDIELFSSNLNFTHGHTAFTIEQLVNLSGTKNIEGNTTGSNLSGEQREQTKSSKNKGGVYNGKIRPFVDTPSLTIKGWVRFRE